MEQALDHLKGRPDFVGQLRGQPSQVGEPLEPAENLPQFVGKNRCGKDDQAGARPEEGVHAGAGRNPEDVVPRDHPIVLEITEKAECKDHVHGKQDPPPLREEKARAGDQEKIGGRPDHRVDPAEVVERDGHGSDVDPEAH